MSAHYILNTARPAVALALSAALTASLFSSSVAAGDPAFVGGNGYDSAKVDAAYNRQLTTSQAPASSPQSNQAPTRNPDSAMTVTKVQGLLDRVSSQIGASNLRAQANQQGRIEDVRNETKDIAAQVWDQLSPNTRQLYQDAYDPSVTAAQTRNNSFDKEGGTGNIADGIRQSKEGMRRMEELLLPMLQDIKNGLDTELRNAATRRR